jgi:hypothetical protein
MNLFRTMTTEKPLIPGLFQLAACADGPVPRNIFSPGQTPFADMMLNPKRLEAILRTLGRLEKPARRISQNRRQNVSR